MPAPSSVTHSTDTFYGILCSGLTDKTPLSFISSNSSFSECERNHNNIYSITLNNDDNAPQCTIDDQTPTNKECSTSSRNDLNQNKNYKFTFCIFSNLNGGNNYGGAIKCTGSNSRLSINKCTFTDCSCTSEASSYPGGAIYAQSISSFSVRHSIFEWDRDTQQAYDGGAICLYTIPSVTIHDNTFTKCYTTGLGGAIFLAESSTNAGTATIINNCKFLSCKGPFNGGGGVCDHHNNQYDNFVTDSIFCKCSTYRAGGFCIIHEPYSHYPPQYCTKYCFFTQNTASFGNDVFVEWYNPDSDPLVCCHCFSTSDSDRVGYRPLINNYWGGDYRKTDRDWLPQTNTNSKVFDSRTTTTELYNHNTRCDDENNNNIVFESHNISFSTSHSLELLYYIPENTYEIISFYSLNS